MKKKKDLKTLRIFTKAVLVFVAAALAYAVTLSFPSVLLQPGDAQSVVGYFTLFTFLGFFAAFLLVLFISYYLYEHNMM